MSKGVKRMRLLYSLRNLGFVDSRLLDFPKRSAIKREIQRMEEFYLLHGIYVTKEEKQKFIGKLAFKLV